MNITEYLKYSIFSDLAYVEWDGSNGQGDEAKDAAIDAEKAPEKLGDRIFKTEGWQVASYCPNTDTGFKASLYDNGQEKILSICGTEPGEQGGIDLWDADLAEIGRLGVAISQTVDMYNYILKLMTPEGQDVNQLTLRYSTSEVGSPPQGEHIAIEKVEVDPISHVPHTVTEYFWFENSVITGGGSGEISAGDKISLTGHSLGGHLATFALRLFPELFDKAVIFNEPGFDPFY